jgi:hypothetical protein
VELETNYFRKRRERRRHAILRPTRFSWEFHVSASTVVIAAAIIAAVRLAREDIGKSSPRLTAVVMNVWNHGKTSVDVLVATRR